ncbi:MAG TPA: DNA repair protein RecN [Solirubrobacterales bacterium]|nr:DNA repair protein RecN [Solirubrobacterales bacterium]
MLHELRIENLLLIERAELRLEPGLNAITGETGAGKTVLAHSLDLLMGGRARPQIVRPGAEEAWVEGVFALPPGTLDDPELAAIAERLPDDADEVVLGRRIGSSGRTSAFIGGRSASAAELRELGSRLLAFYGQHEHRKLMLASAQLEILDGFAGVELLEFRDRYRAAHAEAAGLARELAELREREGARERDLDLMRFELSEIEAAAPSVEEGAELESERGLLRNAEGRRTAAARALAAIGGDEADGGGAGAALAEADSGLAGAAGADPELDQLAERLRAAAVELDDVASDLRGYLEEIDGEPGRLESVEERLDAFDHLTRKHGGSIEAVLEHAERCRTEIGRLENAEEIAAELESRIAAAQARRAELAAELSARRAKAAAALGDRVAGELAELAMEGARLEVSLEPHPDGFGPNGAETVELQVATNSGMPTSPLKDAASGGELSRIMLALSGLAAGEAERTLVFDEVDAGIGGNTARAVGERLRDLAEGRQVLCITHLPPVAALAPTHFRIEKHAAGGETTATVERVAGDELVAEIVRMLGADRGDSAASRHARELLKAA